MTRSTAPKPQTQPEPQAEPLARQIPIEAVLGRYQRDLSEKTQALYVAQASLDAAEAECSALRLRVIELESAPTAA